jgi:predicted  nucleic acid-binding Zn-ribbon protein
VTFDPQLSGSPEIDTTIKENGTMSTQSILTPRLATAATLLLLASLPLAGCGFVSKGKHDEAVSEKNREIERLQNEAKMRDSYVSELTNTWTEVQDAISAVETEQGKTRQLVSQSETSGPVSASRRDAVLDKVKQIQENLGRYRTRMADLEKKLGAEKGANEKLRVLVVNLQKTIDSKEKEIGQLRTDLESLRTTVARLEEEGQQKDKVIGEKTKEVEERTSEVEAARRELDKCFWTFGRPKELLEKGVVTKTGGFIGLGKSLTPAENLDASHFEQLEISKTSELSIPYPLKEVQFVTRHAKGSYELIGIGPKLTTLRIKNPAEFWRLGKFLIIAID